MRINKSLFTIPREQRRYKFPAVLFVVLAASCLAGCSSLGVKPHQRGLLAKESMLLVSDAVEVGLDDHVYFSKEATSGGRGFGGGGCGCN
jgi:hypothetical protein